MKIFLTRVRRFLNSEAGPAAIEYAVMLALIMVVCLASVRTIGRRTKTAFNTVSKSLVVKSGGS